METIAHYLVELDRPSNGWLALQGASGRARKAAEQLRVQGGDVRFIRAIYVPEDDTCFFLIEASSPQLVDEVGSLAEVAFRRITAPVAEGAALPRSARSRVTLAATG